VARRAWWIAGAFAAVAAAAIVASQVRVTVTDCWGPSEPVSMVTCPVEGGEVVVPVTVRGAWTADRTLRVPEDAGPRAACGVHARFRDGDVFPRTLDAARPCEAVVQQRLLDAAKRWSADVAEPAAEAWVDPGQCWSPGPIGDPGCAEYETSALDAVWSRLMR
jgi:hypothetical protein